VRPLFLGVDVGTASTKGVVVDHTGAIVARARREHATASPRPGWFEHDPIGIWWDEFLAVVRELVDAVKGAIWGVAVSGIGPCLLPADESGRPLRPAILYGIDTRATAEISELTYEIGADVIVQEGGSPLTSQAIGPKVLWLRRNEPRVWERTRRFFMAGSYLVYRLTGEYVLDHHSASQCDPLYDIRAEDWHARRCEQIAPGLVLPRLAWADEVAGTVSAAAAGLTGLPAGIPVTAGTIDAWAEAESVGVSQTGDAMVMYGSTMFLVDVLDELRPSPRYWTTSGLHAGTRTAAAGMSTAGALTAWIADLVGGDFGSLADQAARVPAGCDGLLTLPYFAGERSPIFDEQARGMFAGLTLRHTAAHLYRSALESVGFGVRHNLEAMTEAGAPVTRLVAVGGGTTSRLWPQIVSDISQRSQDVPRHTVGAALGDAMLAAQAAGHADRAACQAWNPVDDHIEPNRAHAGLYDDLYSLYRAAYTQTAPLMHRLAGYQAST
jgi:xylulokinase